MGKAYFSIMIIDRFVMFSEAIVSTVETDGKIKAENYEAAYEETPEEDRTYLSLEKRTRKKTFHGFF